MPPFTPLAHGVVAVLVATALVAQRPESTAELRPSPPRTRIAFGSCAHEARPQPIWEQVLAAEPDLFVFAGDNVYGDTEDMTELRAKYARLGAVEGFARLRERAPILATWDDHDYGANDAGADYPRRTESQQAFLDFFEVPADDPRRAREGVYHCEVFGPVGRRVQVILLDTRFHRSALDHFARAADDRRSVYRPHRDRDATLLGPEQWQWLEARLREPAELRLVVSSIQVVAEEHDYEKWGNLPLERERLLRLIRDTGATGVVFLSGDRHHAELSRLADPDAPYPLFDLTASGLNQSQAPRPDAPFRIAEPNRHRVGAVVRGHHFGVVDVDWERDDPLVSLQIVMRDGTRPIEHELRLSDLRAGERARTQVGDSRRDADRIVVDGDCDEWPAAAGALLADAAHLHLRFTTDTERTLGSSDESVRICLDADGDDATGVAVDGLAGTDLSIEFSPRPERGRRRSFMPTILRHRAAADGPIAEPIGADVLGLVVQPTAASRRFELRLRRDALGALGARADVRVVARPHAGDAERVLASASIPLPQTAAAPRTPPALPAKDTDALRVVSWNVLWATPQRTPDAYGPVLRALAPDVVLLQEWDSTRYSARELTEWFRSHVDPERDWQAMVTGTGGYGQGTAVVTPHPIHARLPAHLPVEDGRWNFPVRVAAAAIDTPHGRLLAASVHLKASGALATDEDRRRLAEARAVNHALLGLAAGVDPGLVVVGGDVNLLGTVDVLGLLGRDLDRDGSALTIAEPRHLADPALVHTWIGDAWTSRLDYLLFSDASATARTAFVVDPQTLGAVTASAAPAAGRGSDHLPVVVDLRPRSTRGQ